MRKILTKKNENGFVLLFAIVFLSVIMTIIASQADTLLAEFRATGQEERSLMALFAADAAVACVGFYDVEYTAFDTRKPQGTYNCGVGTFTAGGINQGAQQCAAHTYQFRLNNFTNGACADVEVITRPASFLQGTVTVYVCDLTVIAHGKNTCDPSALNVVERVRIAN